MCTSCGLVLGKSSNCQECVDSVNPEPPVKKKKVGLRLVFVPEATSVGHVVGEKDGVCSVRFLDHDVLQYQPDAILDYADSRASWPPAVDAYPFGAKVWGEHGFDENVPEHSSNSINGWGVVKGCAWSAGVCRYYALVMDNSRDIAFFAATNVPADYVAKHSAKRDPTPATPLDSTHCNVMPDPTVNVDREAVAEDLDVVYTAECNVMPDPTVNVDREAVAEDLDVVYTGESTEWPSEVVNNLRFNDRVTVTPKDSLSLEDAVHGWLHAVLVLEKSKQLKKIYVRYDTDGHVVSFSAAEYTLQAEATSEKTKGKGAGTSKAATKPPPQAPAAQAADAPDETDDSEGHKKTVWVHTTRITCLKLIHAKNPFAAKDTGAMWVEIAEQIAKDTAGVQVLKGKKLVSCQVRSNGPALMMWYNRQQQRFKQHFSEEGERTQSGQTGTFSGAARKFADDSGERAEEVEAEWTQLRSLRNLQNEANRVADMKRRVVASDKHLRNQEVVDLVIETATHDVPTETKAIALLEKKLKKTKQLIQAMGEAGRCRQMTVEEEKDFKLLQNLKEQRRERRKKQAEEAGVEPPLSDDDEDVAETSDAKDTGQRHERGFKGAFQGLSKDMSELTACLKADARKDTGLTLEQTKAKFQQLEKDINAGLEMTLAEQNQVRMMILKQYARGALHLNI
jgi:hypothetical protein